MQTSSVKCFGRERGMHQLIGKWYKFCQMLGRERGMHCPEGVQIHFHVCVLLCSAAAVCHHDLCWLLLCFIKYKSPRFFLFPCMCVVVLCGCCWPPWFVSAPSLFYWIRFDGIGEDCTAGKVHSDLPKKSFNQIWWDRGRLCCRESAQWLAQRVIQLDLIGFVLF